MLKNLLQHHSSKALIFSVLSFLYGPALTSIHDYWKNHSFDKDRSLSAKTKMYSACELNKQGDNIQPGRTPFPIWNQSVVPCLVLHTEYII